MSTEILDQDEFTLILREFNKLITNQPPIDKVKSTLEEMKETAANSNELNMSQKDAILSRCNHYLAGTYGSTSRELKNK